MKQRDMSEKEVFNRFIKPNTGEICEIRALGCSRTSRYWDGYAKGTVHGYFDSHQQFCECLANLNKAADHHSGINIYMNLQVINPSLINRACNRLVAAKAATTDKDVIAYRWLPVDLDPVRVAEISSSDEELDRARQLSEKISSALAGKWPSPIKAVSGNGYHLLYPLSDLPAQDKKNQQYVKGILEQLSAKFSNDYVKVDTALYNPARIIKLYGTKACKGDSVPPGPNRVGRPHRKSFIYCLGDSGE
jgi:hypothetical protein